MRDSSIQKIKRGQAVRLGIMGGTFDPIHNGHIYAAQAAYEQLHLDEVMFLPAGNPNFKQSRHLEDAQERLHLCQVALEQFPHFFLDDREITRQGITFTADTLHELHEELGENVQLFYIVGTDCARSLPTWHRAQEIAQLAEFIIITRPGESFDKLDEIDISQAGFMTHLVTAKTPDVSSTYIRELLLEGVDISSYVPKEVAAYIHEKQLYTGQTYGQVDPFSEEFFAARAYELKYRVKPKRFKHIMGVSETAELLAQTYGVDVKSAKLAGLLHDWDKNYDDEGIRQRADELHIQIDPYVYENLPRVLHAHTAAAAIARDFPQVPAEICQAIDRHTIAATDMTPLDMVIYIADALEPNRVYDNLLDLRALIGKVSLEELFFTIYKYWISRMMERNMLLHPNTVEIWNTYVLKYKSIRKDKEKHD